MNRFTTRRTTGRLAIAAAAAASAAALLPLTAGPAHASTGLCSLPDQSWTVGHGVLVFVTCNDPGGVVLAIDVTGLPAGLREESNSPEQIDGTPTTASSGQATIEARDSNGVLSFTTFNWVVKPR